MSILYPEPTDYRVGLTYVREVYEEDVILVYKGQMIEPSRDIVITDEASGNAVELRLHAEHHVKAFRLKGFNTLFAAAFVLGVAVCSGLVMWL